MYHVNKNMLLKLYDPFPDVEPGVGIDPATLTGNSTNATRYRRWLQIKDNVFDLTDLFDDVTTLLNAPSQVLDPSTDADEPETQVPDDF